MTPWLPLISSLVIASVTIVGIRINNRTNRAAIAAADDREYSKWQRETLLRLCSEAIESALNAQGDLTQFTMVPSPDDDASIKNALKEIDGHARKIGAITPALYMLGADEVGDECLALRAMFSDANLILSAYMIADAISSHDYDGPRTEAQRKDDIEESRQIFNAAFQEVEAARDRLTRAAKAELERHKGRRGVA
ncbi:hypothetical protein [Nocardia sp. NPDC005366]|uniref:hypothetical protein n=1 Tax=Nocardia sp. NPDC005366 TaxID=3156878 RepID=UPI0033B6C7F8